MKPPRPAIFSPIRDSSHTYYEWRPIIHASHCHTAPPPPQPCPQPHEHRMQNTLPFSPTHHPLDPIPLPRLQLGSTCERRVGRPRHLRHRRLGVANRSHDGLVPLARALTGLGTQWQRGPCLLVTQVQKATVAGAWVLRVGRRKQPSVKASGSHARAAGGVVACMADAVPLVSPLARRVRPRAAVSLSPGRPAWRARRAPSALARTSAGANPTTAGRDGRRQLASSPANPSGGCARGARTPPWRCRDRVARVLGCRVP
eukprot:scaffold12491_cov95-Isochrysis_galbana.AAC.3